MADGHFFSRADGSQIAYNDAARSSRLLSQLSGVPVDYECINPEFREWISVVVESSAEEIAALDFEGLGQGDLCECRLHWNCCPSCRHEFPSLPRVAAQAGPGYEKVRAAELEYCKNNFQAKKDLLLQSGGEDTYIRLIVELAKAEREVHTQLTYWLAVLQTLYQGREVAYDTDKREILPACLEFVSSLDREIQRFVISATLCFELLRPMWEKLGLLPSQEQIIATTARLARLDACDDATEVYPDLDEILRAEVEQSGLEPRALWGVIEVAASARVSGEVGAGIESLIERKFRELSDDVDSLKAGQMALVQLSERSTRKAEDYEPDISARIGQPLYSQLTEMTRRLLTVAEYLYHINSQETNHFDGPVMKMAVAYENELKENVVVPILRDLLADGVENYGSLDEPLIRHGKLNNTFTTGTVARYLRTDAEFATKIRARGFNPEAIMKDAYDVKRYRDRAAHDLACERAVAEDLRGRVLRPDGVLSRLHPATKCK